MKLITSKTIELNLLKEFNDSKEDQVLIAEKLLNKETDNAIIAMSNFGYLRKN